MSTYLSNLTDNLSEKLKYKCKCLLKYEKGKENF